MDATVRALMALARARSTLLKVDHAIAIVPEQNVIRALADWFASAVASSAADLPGDLIDLLVASGITRTVAEQVGEMVLAAPMPSLHADTPAMEHTASQEPQMRAMYVLAACKRLTADPDATTRESHYLDQHVAAGRGRRAAAKAVDDLDAQLLVWRTQEDSRVEARCAILDHRLFMIDSPPDGVYPGAAHPKCRCYAEVWGSPLFQP